MGKAEIVLTFSVWVLVALLAVAIAVMLFYTVVEILEDRRRPRGVLKPELQEVPDHPGGPGHNQALEP